MKNSLFFLFLFTSSIALSQTQKVLLSLGGSQLIPLGGQSSVWVQDKEILKAESAGGSLRIRGAREGRTLLKVGSRSYSIQVLHPSQTDSFEDLQRELKSMVGLSARVDEGDILVQGNLYRMKDWIRVAELARSRNFSYQMRAEMTEDLKSEAQKYFEEALSQAKLPPQSLIFQPSLEVRVNTSSLEFKKYLQLLRPFGIQVLKDDSSLEIAPTVKIQITVAEIKHNLSRQYGITWPSSYSARVISRGKTEFDPLPFNLKALEDSGNGKILASPNIICRSGKEAEFLAGGEFPIKLVNFKSQEIVWKRYGILLKVKPKADATGRISLSIETEITTLDKATSVDNIPGLLTNRVSSHFDLTRPQTIALSGLLKSEDGESSSGLPLLSRLPVLGALFSSKDFRENRSELVIFVRPVILKEGENNSDVSHLTEKGNI